jgi:hypothetical protein
MSVNALLAAARKVLDKEIEQPPNGFQTREQWARALDKGVSQAGVILRAAVAAGDWEMIPVRIRTGQVVRPVPHYGPRRETPKRASAQ